MYQEFRRSRGLPQAFRRAHDRYPVDAAGIAYIQSKDQEGVSLVKNISLRGVGIISNYPLDRGERVAVSIQSALIKNSSQNKTARVVWSRQVQEGFWHTGLEMIFTSIIEFNRKA
jgi:hypothetical protein